MDEVSGESGEPWPEVGDFRPGSPLSRWALARYLVGRSIGESVGVGLLVVGLLILAGAGVLTWAGWIVVAVLVGLVGVGVLVLRAVLLAVLRRLTATPEFSPVGDRLRDLVADTRGDVLRELRRLRLPAHTWTVPLLALRLLRRRRRAQTVERLRSFDIDRVVPAARIDELHLLLQSARGRDVPPAG
jgi:hypothetical protein